MVPLTDALAAAHEKGITHRDLKPQNVMVGAGGRVKVLDFGLAKFAPQWTNVALGSEVATEAKTQEGVIVGTMPYMSPEQVQGGKTDSRSDVFSLGVLLYEMATGRRPFQGESAIRRITTSARAGTPAHPSGTWMRYRRR